MSDVISVKVKSAQDVVAWNEMSLQAFFEPNARDTERWLDVYPFQTSPDRKRRFLPFNAREDRPKRLGRLRIKMILELPQGAIISDPESPTRILPKAESPPLRPPSRDEVNVIESSPKRPPSRGSEKQRPPSRGESPAKRPPSRADSSVELRREDSREEAKIHSPSRSVEIADISSSSFKIDLQSAIENQARGSLFPEDVKPDLSGCMKCAKLSQISQVQEDQINQLVDTLWRKYAGLLSRVNDPDSESLPILTRFSLGRPDPTTMVAVPLPAGGLTRSESEAYQKILQSLNSQLKILQLAEHEEELLREKVGISANSYSELQSSLRETQVQMAKLEDGQKAVMNAVAQDKAEIDRDREVIEKNIKRKTQDIFELTEELAQLQSDEDARLRAAADFRKLAEGVAQTYSEFSAAFQSRCELEREYANFVNMKAKEIEGQMTAVEQSRGEISDLHKQVRKLREQLADAKSKRETLESQSIALKDKLSTLESEEVRATDNRNILESHTRLTKTLGDIAATTGNSYTENEKIYEDAIAVVQDLNDTLSDRRAQTIELLAEAKNLLELKKYRMDGKHYAELMEETSELEDELTVLKGYKVANVPIVASESKQFTDTLVRQLTLLSDVTIAETLKSAGASVVVNRLKSQLETLNKALDAATADFYKRFLTKGVYTPDENDQCDVAVAEIVNQARDIAVVPVLRLEPGRYLFGTSAISVELKGGKVHVAKGLQNIELGNYVELYAPVELQKVTMALSQT